MRSARPYSVHGSVMLELLQHNQTLATTGLSANKRLLQLRGVLLQRQEIIRKDDDLVAAPLVVVDKKLTGADFVWVHNVEKLATAETVKDMLAEKRGRRRLKLTNERSEAK